MFRKIKEWYMAQNSTTKGLIWVGIALLIGIILRWDYVWSHILKGFNFYSTK
ncbi:MAG: hypothetical protein PHD07_02090 [Bacteroidales bacterium]|nr:hypothetical protein [Bacteroidales bacterium]MDD3200619.1 hypothetical protein [Bacteroidales bacterium]